MINPPYFFGDKLEARVVEQRLLQTSKKTESKVVANLADFTQEVEIENHFLVVSGAQIVEQFVHEHQ